MLSKEFLPESHLTDPKSQPKSATEQNKAAKKVEKIINGVVPKKK